MQRSKTSRLAIPTTLVVGLLGLTLAACATTRGAGQQTNDAAITSKVTTKLVADPQTNEFEIGVDTVNGVVRLSGTVENEVARREAETLARDTEGVQRVINDIQVGDLTVGENVDDAIITSRVKARLAVEEVTGALNVDVDTENGVVTLFGQVENQAAANAALEIAATTPGVKQVQNRLQLSDGRAAETPQR